MPAGLLHTAMKRRSNGQPVKRAMLVPVARFLAVVGIG
jgi:hypothetical protein